MAEGSDVDYWGLVTIIGPLLLLGIIIWAIARNRSRKDNKARMDTTERATRENYQREHDAHEGEPGSGL